MSLDGVFPCAWSELWNNLIKHSDPDDLKIMRAVPGFGIQGNKRQSVQQSGLGGAARGCSMARGLLPAVSGLPGAGRRASRKWQWTPGQERAGTSSQDTPGLPGLSPKPSSWGARQSAWAGAQLRVWMVPLEIALSWEVLTGLILTRNCKG